MRQAESRPPAADAALPARARRGVTVRRLSDRLVESWRRSEDYGVSLEGVEPRFAGAVDRDTLFYDCGHEVLQGLHQTLANEPISLMLTDAEGLVLNRFCGDGSLLRALDAVHLAPGFSYAEREIGTNGLGLALADRAPIVVRADEHYSANLCTYTCAAVPVLDPVTGRLEGAVNLTTWSQSSSDLLLALAQAAAGTTAALMLARTRGRTPRPAPRGKVFRVESARLEPGSGTLHDLSDAWTDAVAEAAAAMSAGRVVAAVGEPGSGRATLLAQAFRRASPRDRVISANPPEPQDIEHWLGLWTPELGKAHTAVIVGDVDTLPAWAAQRLHDIVAGARPASGGLGTVFSATAESFDSLPAALAGQIETVVTVPRLRDRVADILPLARHTAFRVRGREVDFTPAAVRALEVCGWPGNVEQLVQVVRQAASRADVVDVRHLPPEVSSGSRHRLSRIEAFERDEIVRCLTRPGVSVTEAAAQLEMSRATLYRKIAHYDIHVDRS